MRNKIYAILSQPYSVVITLILATLFSFADRNYGYFFGLGVALVYAWSGKFNWSIFGWGKRITLKTVLLSIIIAVLSFGLIDVLIQPMLEKYYGTINLNSLQDIQGDLLNYSIILVIMWIFAALGEEFLFHGYYMKGIARLFGDSNLAWIGAAIFISAYFGFSHNYQGTAGMIAVGLGGLINALLFCYDRKNLALLVLVHGIYDTIGLTLLYFGMYPIQLELFK